MNETAYGVNVINSDRNLVHVHIKSTIPSNCSNKTSVHLCLHQSAEPNVSYNALIMGGYLMQCKEPLEFASIKRFIDICQTSNGNLHQ